MLHRIDMKPNKHKYVKIVSLFASALSDAQQNLIDKINTLFQQNELPFLN